MGDNGVKETTLRERLKQEEGFSDVPYRCPAGHWTIGYGHNMEASPLPVDIRKNLDVCGRITHSDAERLLDADIERAEIAAKVLFPNYNELTVNRRGVLVDMAFNMGEATLGKFKRMRAAVLKNDYETAAQEMEGSRWFSQVGDRSKRLVKIMREG